MYKNATFLIILGPYKPNKSVLELWKNIFSEGAIHFSRIFNSMAPLIDSSRGQILSAADLVADFVLSHWVFYSIQFLYKFVNKSYLQDGQCRASVQKTITGDGGDEEGYPQEGLMQYVLLKN